MGKNARWPALLIACLLLSPLQAQDAAPEAPLDLARVREALVALDGPASRDAPLRVERRAALESLQDTLQMRELRLEAEGRGGDDVATTLPPAPSGPPFDTLALDEDRDRADAASSELAAIDAAIESLARDEERHAAELRRQRTEQRLWNERAQTASTVDDRNQSAARAELATWLARHAALLLEQSRESIVGARARKDGLQAMERTLSERIDRARQQQVLGADGLARALAGVAVEREDVARRLDELHALRLAYPEDAAALARAELAVRELDAILAGREQVWRLRERMLAQSGQDEEPAAAVAILDQAISQLADRLRWSERQLEYASASRPVGGPGSQAAAGLMERQARRDLQDAMRRSQVLLERTRDDVARAASLQGGPSALARVAATLRELARAVWETELFVVTDTVRIDGRDVQRDLGVTVGKSLGALFLLALGYAAARLAILPALRLLMRRLRVEPGRASTIIRWITTLLWLCLVIVVLKLARIPLVAFAFLGGALAIGIGFGAQTLLRNLMSGMLLLAENKVRVGDVLTVGGVSGTCADIGLRATTLRGFDGIDVILPNATLLESPIQNWTAVAPMVRREVRVMLPHAGAERMAAASIAQCAADEPGILASPAPEVLLSRLAEDGVELTLQVWVALTGGPSAPVVESRLRFAIARALSAQGIAIGAQRSTTIVAAQSERSRPFWADANPGSVVE